MKQTLSVGGIVVDLSETLRLAGVLFSGSV